MYFNSDEAWNFLLSNGYVFTLRHINPHSKAFAKVWFYRHGQNTGRVGSKKLVSIVDRKGKATTTNYADLPAFVHGSGFPSIDMWLLKAQELSGAVIELGVFEVRTLLEEEKKA